jgi:hypothetical protein
MIETLSSYKKLIQIGSSNWKRFQETRLLRLKQMSREGGGAEKITENILEDLCTQVLDWCISDINYQIQHADLILTHVGIKRLVIEAKRPMSLAWKEHAVHKALDQAQRYADQQRVNVIAVSDGHMLYAADVKNGGLNERLYLSLDEENFPEDLWWLSVHGIYKSREAYVPKLQTGSEIIFEETETNELLHPKYKIPSRCFAYVENSVKPGSWKLPYLLHDGEVDTKRLSGAIRCITSNYRGANVSGIPDAAIPDVLRRLATAAERIGKMPHQNPKTSDCFIQLTAILGQLK